MFDEFWLENKNQIQFLSILTGIGALFLSIEPPPIDSAREALANIQLFWLIVIAISASLIFVRVYIFVLEIERHYKSQWGVNVTETVSLVSILGWFYLIGNLSNYITALYEKELWSFLRNINLGIISTLFTLYLAAISKMYIRIKPLNYRILVTLISHGVFSATLSLGNAVVIHSGSLPNFWEWFLVFNIF